MIQIIFFLLSFLKINSNEKITVHILSHSHDDPGWIKTFDQYYNDQVEKILNNVVYSLKKDKTRKFIYSEISFFRKWYESIDEKTKNDIKELIKEKRFEFVNGGYVMEDNAASHFRDGISQLRLGLEFLKENFNITPKIVWALDQFGYSMAHTYFYQQFGFNRVVVNRISENIIKNWSNTHDLDFIWNLFNMNKTKILTHMIYDYYCPPQSIREFCDDHIITGLDNNNTLKNYAQRFLNNINTEMKGYKHHHYALYYGCDFTFTATEVNFLNIEKLMNYINESPDFNQKLIMKYSTVNEFFNEFEKELKDENEYKNLREFSDDWFPYIDQYSLTWTGYFTSRPYMKGKSRESSILYDVISMLNTEYFFQFHKSNHDFFTSQEPAQKAIALVQHHDGIAGTGKSFVHEDYINQLIEGDEIIMKKSGEILDDIFNYKNIKVCLSNGKVNLGCKFDLVKYENGEFKFGIYNPGLNGKILFTIELDFSFEKVKFHLFDHYKRKIGYNFICIPDFKCYVNFIFGFDREFSFFHFTFSNIENDKRIINKKNLTGIIDIKHDKYIIKQLKYDTSNFTFNLIFYGQEEREYIFKISHEYFQSNSGGAYVSEINNQLPKMYKIILEESFYVENEISTNIYLKTEGSSLLITLYNYPFLIQTTSVLNPTSKNNVKSSIDIILNIQSNLQTNGEFYTDSNGIKMQKRSSITNSIKHKIYPIGRAISIKENNNKITIYNDRPEGGTSLGDGNLLVILNRMTASDDNKGCFENLYEKESTSVSFETKQIISFSNGFDEQKINFLANNYFTNNLLLFYSEKEGSLRFLDDNFEKDFYGFSTLTNVFIFTDKIKMNVFYISKKRILVQFFNEYDNYFDGKNQYENFSNILSVDMSKKDFKIAECNINGIECQEINLDNKHGTIDGFIHYRLYPLEFKVFELKY